MKVESSNWRSISLGSCPSLCRRLRGEYFIGTSDRSRSNYSFPPKRAPDHGTRGRIQAIGEPRAAEDASVPLYAIDPLQDSRLGGFIEKDPRAPGFHIKEQNARNQPLVDYYKCPEEFGEIEVKGELSEGAGFFQFAPGT